MATHSNILSGKFHGQRSLVGYSSTYICLQENLLLEIKLFNWFTAQNMLANCSDFNLLKNGDHFCACKMFGQL